MWLAACDAYTAADGGAPRGPARDTFRAAIARDVGRVFAVVDPGEQARCIAWVEALGDEVGALGDVGPAALCWAAIAVWDDVGTPWRRFARALERLARKVEPEGADVAAARAADGLRATMDRHAAVLWRRRAA